jgi:ATP-dependent helicase/nuclease subunit B
MELDLFHPTAVTCEKLLQMCAAEKVTVAIDVLQQKPAPRFAQAEPLAVIEQRYQHRRASDVEADLDKHVGLVAASNRRTEVEHVASQMIALVRDGGYRWRDLAVLMRSPEGYADLFEHVFATYDIPYFLDAKKGVMEQPLIEFIRSGLEVVYKGWQYDAIFRCLKTDLMTAVLTDLGKEDARRMVDELENYVLAFGIKGTMWTNDRPWTYRTLRSIEDENPGANELELAKIARMNDIRAKIVTPFRALEQALKQAHNVKAIASAIYNWLEAVQVPVQLAAWSEQYAAQGDLRKAKELAKLWSEVLDWLDQLVEVLGEQEIGLADVDRLLEAGLEGLKLGAVPPSLDQVVIGSLERTRFGGIKHAFVVGVNDGVFPAKFAEESLLSELERGLLAAQGVELAPDARRKLLDEQFMVYQALTLASDKLWLSYALANEEGAAMLPSEIVRRMQMLFPSLEVTVLAPEPSHADERDVQLRHMAHPAQALAHLILQLRTWRNGTAIHDVWWQTYQQLTAMPTWRNRLKQVTSHLFYTNIAAPLSRETTLLLYGDTLTSSVSKMEMFNQCAFQYFSAAGLKLKERQIYKLDTPDIGQLFHAALSHIGKQLLEQRRSWGSITSVESKQLAEHAVTLFGPRLQNEILQSSSRFKYIADKFKNVLARTIDVMSEHGRRGEFTPVGLELAFGRGEQLPAFPMQLDGGAKMDIIGRIDRIDQAERDGQLLLRVIDYKSSAQTLRLDKLYYGLSLQLLTYLDVAVTNAEQWLGRKAKPAGMLYMHVHNPLITSKNDYAQEQLLEEQFKSFKLKGYLLDDVAIVKLMDNTLEEKVTSLVIPAGLTKEGNWNKQSSKVMSEQQLQDVRQFVRGKISQVGNAILNGHIAIEPTEISKQKPCTYCSFKAVCQIDTTLPDQQVRHLKAMKDEQTWEQISLALGKEGRA